MPHIDDCNAHGGFGSLESGYTVCNLRPRRKDPRLASLCSERQQCLLPARFYDGQVRGA